MKKIVSLLLFTVLLIPALLAVEYIPVEESQRIRITRYKVNEDKDYVRAYDRNDIEIEYVSAYSDIDYTVKPKTGKALYSPMTGAFYVSYAEKIPFRVEFKKDSNPDVVYYQDIVIPCIEPNLVSEDVSINVYTGNTTEFGAVAGNEVYVQVLLPDEMYYSGYGNSGWYVTDGEDNVINAGFDARDLEEYPEILTEEESIAGKYKFCVELLKDGERKVAIKEFELVE